MLALIVEPSESHATLCVKSLSPQGIETAWMPNAETAIQYCREHVIDILICHVILKDMSGYEVLAAISKDQPIPAFMIAGLCTGVEPVRPV
jgi:CheY-like chemotaxis protein